MKKRPPLRPRKLRILNARKAGIPPGSIVHLGDVKVATPRITLFDYSRDNLTELTFSSLESSRRYQKQNDLVWLNVHGLHDLGIMKEIGTRFSLHPLVLEDIANTQQRTKIEDFGQYSFIVLRVFHYDATQHDAVSDQLSMVAGPGFLITFQERSTGVFEPVRERLRQNAGNIRAIGLAGLIHALLDTVVDQYFVTVEALSNDLDQLEDTILAGKGLRPMEEITHFKREALEIRRALWPLREMLGALLRQQGHIVSGEAQLYFRDVYDHTVHLTEQIDSLREMIGDLLDLHLASVNNRLNSQVRTLTIVTTMFAPATLLTGFFGMNFSYLPGLDRRDGWILVMIGMLVCGLGLLGILLWQLRRQVKPSK